MCWRGAEHILLRERFQPAFASVGRRPGHHHERAPPPCVMVTGLLRTHSCSDGVHKPCVCAGAAQSMFSYARSFNQPLAAWDVGQVKYMSVRRRPASTSWGLLLHRQLLRWRPQAVCVCWRGAAYVQCRELFQPAFGSMGRWPGQIHVGAPPPCVRVTGLLHTHSCSGARPQAVCACWRGAVYVLLHKSRRLHQAAHPR